MNYPVEQWWTQRQLALVEDRGKSWQLQSFEPSPSVEHRIDEVSVVGPAGVGAMGQSVMEDGWDHEHCELCWGKISQLPGDSTQGYTDGDKWLCIECFTRYVQPRLSK